MANKITVETKIDASPEKVWDAFINTEDIKQWNSAAPEWHTPKAVNDVREGGKFNYRMEARDGSMGFDFEGTFKTVTKNQYLEYELADGRLVWVEFKPADGKTSVIQTFDAETVNSDELQKQGWQAILDNFKRFVETKN